MYHFVVLSHGCVLYSTIVRFRLCIVVIYFSCWHVSSSGWWNAAVCGLAVLLYRALVQSHFNVPHSVRCLLRQCIWWCVPQDIRLYPYRYCEPLWVLRLSMCQVPIVSMFSNDAVVWLSLVRELPINEYCVRHDVFIDSNRVFLYAHNAEWYCRLWLKIVLGLPLYRFSIEVQKIC